MGLKFFCSECGAELIVSFARPGDTVTCNSCGDNTDIPEGAIETEEKSNLMRRPEFLEDFESAGGIRAHDLKAGLFSDTRTLKDEALSEVSFTLINNASGNADKVIQSTKKKLEEADMPLQCQWGVVEVKTKGWISRVRREFLIVDVDEFPDYHSYISVRDFGTYLDCVRLLTIEPGFVKRFLSKKLSGDPEGLSAPKNVLKLQDLNAWNEVIGDCFEHAIGDLIAEIGCEPTDVIRERKQLLSIW